MNSRTRSPEKNQRIYISKDLQSFIKFWALVYELSCSQVVAAVAARQGKTIYLQTASEEIIIMWANREFYDKAIALHGLPAVIRI